MFRILSFIAGVRALFRKKQVEQEMDEELRGYLDDTANAKMRLGMNQEEALRAARVEMGSVDAVKEEIRSAGWESTLETIWRDLRFGLRVLRRSPGFTAVAVITLALGIGGTAVVFSLLDAVLLRPLPYPHSERLFRLFPLEGKRKRGVEQASYADFHDWQRQTRTFESLAAYQGESLNLTGTAEPESLEGTTVTLGFFATLGVIPVLGREFRSDDTENVAILSYALWQRRFGSDRGIIGKPIHLEGQVYTVVGVLPPQVRFRSHPWATPVSEIFVPVVPNPARDWHSVRVVGRLALGVSKEQALAEMNGIAARLAQAYPDSEQAQGVAFEPLAQYVVSDADQTVWLLLGAVGFVLLIACANVANLLLSQGAAREREMAIRTAVGASRGRILRQLLTESLLLAGSGGAIGVALAYWAIPLVVRIAPPFSSLFSRLEDAHLHLNWTVLGFSALLSVVSSVMFGALPAWKATRPAQSSLATCRVSRLRGGLIALEVALSLVLLVGAGLMLKSIVRLLEEGVGFRTEHLLTMAVSLSEAKYSTPEKQAAYFDELLRRLSPMAEVVSAGATVDLPLTRSETSNTVEIPGTHPEMGTAGYHAVSAGYFRAMGIPLLNGRELGIADSASSPLVGVINRSMAIKYWPNENPIGKTVVVYRLFRERTPAGTHVQFKREVLGIVGVVGDVRQLGLDVPPDPELFMPYDQWPAQEMSLVLRIAAAPSSLIPRVEKEIWRVDPDQPVTDIKTMDEWVAREAAGRRFILLLIGAFASIAAVLAAVGIYGVASYGMRQRTHEIGVRMALGARRQQIVWLILRQNLSWLVIGIAAGLAGAIVLTRLLTSYLYSVRPTDPATFALIMLVQLAIAGLASYIPARRATKVDPMVALRYE
ncbi:MAG: ABC transporter permease [Terriglobia bacterium]|jgi:putative ABC transport system permease protein